MPPRTGRTPWAGSIASRAARHWDAACSSVAVPFDAPEFILNPVLMRLFNAAYYRVHTSRRARAAVPYQGFFYPLDAVADWNRLYGPRGFFQYQCVLPRSAGAVAVAALLERLGAAGAASLLAVIKDCGPEADA